MPKSNKDILYTEIFGAKVGLPQYYDSEGNPIAISTDNPLPVVAIGGIGGSSMSFLSGETNPTSDIGINGDVYLNTSSGDLYKKENDIWVLQMNLVGPEGPKGEKGNPGTNGEDGAQGPAGADGVSVTGATSDGTNITFNLSDGSSFDVPWPAQ